MLQPPKRETCLIWLLILLKHLYVSGIWLGVTPKTDTKKIGV